MSILFRKVKSAGLFRFTFSKSGVSTRIGPRGLGLSFGKKGTYINAGIPGSGLYSRTKLSGGQSIVNTTYLNDHIEPSGTEEIYIDRYKKKEGQLGTGIWSAIRLLGWVIFGISLWVLLLNENRSEIFYYETLPAIGLILLGMGMIKSRRIYLNRKIDFYSDIIMNKTNIKNTEEPKVEKIDDWEKTRQLIADVKRKRFEKQFKDYL